MEPWLTNINFKTSYRFGVAHVWGCILLRLVNVSLIDWPQNACYFQTKWLTGRHEKTLVCDFFYTPRFNEVERGYTGFTLSVCPSFRLSVCGQNRARSVSSTILTRSILYLHILSINFRRCVARMRVSKLWNLEILANSLNLQFWPGLLLTWDPI